jgi:hypothetical protein
MALPSWAQPYYAWEAKPILEGFSGTPFSSGQERDYTVKFLVRMKDPRMGPIDAAICPGIPKPYSMYVALDGYEFDTLAVVSNISAERRYPDDWTDWIVTVRYSTNLGAAGPPQELGWPAGAIVPNPAPGGGGSAGGNNARENPEFERPTVSWGWDEAQEPALRDLNGDDYINSAGQRFVPAPTFPVARAVLTLSRNELFYNRDTATRYSHCVNEETFLRADPETCLCMPPQAEQQYRGELAYWRVTYRFKFNDPDPDLRHRNKRPTIGAIYAPPLALRLKSWQPLIMDTGLMQRRPHDAPLNPKKLEQCFVNGHPASEPVCLDLTGRQLQPEEVLGADDLPAWKIVPKYIYFRQYPKVSFRTIFRDGVGHPLAFPTNAE